MQMKAKTLLNDIMHHRNSPSISEMDKVKNLAPVQKVLVFRESEGCIPYTLVRGTGNTVDLILPSGRISGFSLNMFKPFNQGDEEKPTRTDEKPKNKKEPCTGSIPIWSIRRPTSP